MTLKLWGRASSVNVQKVLWALVELDLPFERIDAGGKFGVVDTDPFGRMNPVRRVPVLQDGDFTLWESQAVLRYLAQREGRLLPKDLQGRAIADQWLAFVDTTLMGPFIGVFWQLVRMPEPKRDLAALQAHRKALTVALGMLDGRLREAKWLGGGEFGIADIAAGSILHRIMDLGLMPAEMSGVERWRLAIEHRHGYQVHVAVSYDELRAG